MVNEQTVAVQWKSMKYANAIKILSISLPEKVNGHTFKKERSNAVKKQQIKLPTIFL